MDGTVVNVQAAGGISLALYLLCMSPSSAQVKDPAKRPAGAAQLQIELSSLAAIWTPARAEAWWTKHVEAVETPKVSRSRHPTAMVVAKPSDATPTSADESGGLLI
jgi:hypothetical protein